MPFRTIDPRRTSTRDLHQYIVGSIAPRPIAFVSTLDAEGRANVAPYSFFNAFSSNPPILVFSSNRRVSDNTTKDTLANVRATGECVINLVDYALAQQMALASVEWPHDVSEFDAAGLTPLAADTTKAFRVKESPGQLECKVKDIVTLGEHGGAGHLIICEVWRLHLREDVIDQRGRIDPQRLDLVGRLGRSYYVRCSGEAVFALVQAVQGEAIGFQRLPEQLRHSGVLTGSQLARLAGQSALPTPQEAAAATAQDERLRACRNRDQQHRYVAELLDSGQVPYALLVASAPLAE